MFNNRSIVCVASMLLSWQVHAADFSSTQSATADVAFSHPAPSYTFALEAPQTIPVTSARDAIYGTIRLASIAPSDGVPAESYRWGIAWDPSSTDFLEVITNDGNDHRWASLKGQRNNLNRLKASIWYGNPGDAQSILIGNDRYWVKTQASQYLVAQITGRNSLQERVAPDTYKMVINAVVYRE